MPPTLKGVFAAAVTPLTPVYHPDLEAVPAFLDFLAGRGCHGVLLLGTTGEGPSFSQRQRLAVMQASLEVRRDHPDFHLLAGTGTPSLDESVQLTKAAFDLGLDGVVVLPPFYFRASTEHGLFDWFESLIRRAVPSDGLVFAYHIPPVTGIPFSLDLLDRLKSAFPVQFAGLKDSSGDPAYAKQLGVRFGYDLCVFSGNDRFFSLALQEHAAGCITAPANVISPLLRCLWDAFTNDLPIERIQERISASREILERYQPAPALLKALLARRFGFPRWPVCPPLQSFPIQVEDQVLSELELA